MMARKVGDGLNRRSPSSSVDTSARSPECPPPPSILAELFRRSCRIPHRRRSASRTRTVAARRCSLTARVSAGRATGNAVEKGSPRLPLPARSSRLHLLPSFIDCSARTPFASSSPKTCGWRRTILSTIASTTSSKPKAPDSCGRSGHGTRPGRAGRPARPARSERFPAFYRVGDLVGLLDRVRSDRAKRLDAIPRTTAFGIAQPCHDADELFDGVHEPGWRLGVLRNRGDKRDFRRSCLATVACLAVRGRRIQPPVTNSTSSCCTLAIPDSRFARIMSMVSASALLPAARFDTTAQCA